MTSTKAKPDGKIETPLLEWIAAGIGLLLTLTMIGVIGREALNGENEELPVITVVPTGMASGAAGYVLAFEASNKTGGTAAAVEIEAKLMDGQTVIETGKATLDYVAGHGTAEGGVFLANDPKRHKLEIRALGYQKP